MNLYLVRHGESIGNTKRGFVSGRTDREGLTIKGKSQIIRVSLYLNNQKPLQIFTSPVTRARESANIIGNLLNIPIQTYEFLNELDYGVTGGKFWWETKHLLPHHWFQEGRREDFKTRYPGGESFENLAKRVWEGYQEHLFGDSSRLIIVTHQAIIATLVFSATVGNPCDYETEYLAFVHSFYTPNGGIVYLSDHGSKINMQEVRNLLPLESSRQNARFYLAGVFGLSQKKISLHHITTVSKNNVYKIRANDQYIFKILSDRYILASQRLVKLYRFLRENTEIPIPHLIHYDESGIFFPYSLLLQDYKKGVELSRCLKKHSHSILKILKIVLNTLERLHLIELDRVSRFWYPIDWDDATHRSWVKHLSSEIEITRKTVDRFQLSQTKKSYLKVVLIKLQSYVESNNYKVVPLHADPSPNNIIILHEKNECDLTGILDFDRARVGDPLWDIVYFYGWMERTNKQAASVWKKLIKNSPWSYDLKIFEWYRILFHAWTVRDMFDYPNNNLRKKVGLSSLALL